MAVNKPNLKTLHIGTAADRLSGPPAPISLGDPTFDDVDESLSVSKW